MSKNDVSKNTVVAKNEKLSRRKFLTGAAVAAGGAATLGFPMIAKAQAGPITMRWQSSSKPCATGVC